MNPLLIFLLLFVGIPLVELYFLIQVGSEIGAFPTIFLTIFTALVGGMMVRMQGFSTLMRVREATQRNEMPAIEMMEGAVLLVCGVLLLLPGFITDVVGFIFLVPPIRRWLLTAGLQGSGILRPIDPEAPQPRRGQEVIEGEFKREEDDTSPRG
jgi:UPF0716 protein FxsA